MLICLIIVGAVLALDQLSKLVFMDNYIVIIKNILIFEPRYNYGAAFSSLEGSRVFFLVFTSVALVVLFWALFNKKWSTSKLLRIAIAILIGGVLGNFIDRVFIGPVRDFIHVKPLGFVCNVADIAITVACVLLFVYIFFFRDDDEKRMKEKTYRRQKNVEDTGIDVDKI